MTHAIVKKLKERPWTENDILMVEQNLVKLQNLYYSIILEQTGDTDFVFVFSDA